MKSKRMTKAQSSNGKRGRKSVPGVMAVVLIKDDRPRRDGRAAVLGAQGLDNSTLGDRGSLRLVDAVEKKSRQPM